MKHYIVLLDRAAMPGEMRIPGFDHVWVEHPHTQAGGCVDHLWRATIGVTHESSVTGPDIDGCPKLALLVVTGEDLSVVDQAACRQRGIRLIHLPRADRPPQVWAEALMDAIEDFARPSRDH